MNLKEKRRKIAEYNESNHDQNARFITKYTEYSARKSATPNDEPEAPNTVYFCAR